MHWAASCPRRVVYLATHQFAHAALLSHAVLTLVVQTHLAGFAAEAVLRRVSRQEHHMLGRRTW